MTTRQRLLARLRRHPRLYDTLHRLWRRTLAPHDEMADFLEAWSRGKQEVTFLQIGANDGMANDPLREFIVAQRWRGVAVEPLPDLSARLKHSYAHCPFVTVEGCAVGYGIGEEASLYRLRREAQARLPVWADQIASFNREHLLKHFPELTEGEIEEVRVPVLTIEALLAKHGLRNLTLLHLDVEGYEANLLRHLDLGTVRPSLIIYERAHLPEEAAAAIQECLSGHGYRVEPMGCDAVAIRQEPDHRA